MAFTRTVVFRFQRQLEGGNRVWLPISTVSCGHCSIGAFCLKPKCVFQATWLLGCSVLEDERFQRPLCGDRGRQRGPGSMAQTACMALDQAAPTAPSWLQGKNVVNTLSQCVLLSMQRLESSLPGPLSCVGPHLEIGDINKIYFIFYYVGTCGCVHWVSLELEL